MQNVKLFEKLQVYVHGTCYPSKPELKQLLILGGGVMLQSPPPQRKKEMRACDDEDPDDGWVVLCDPSFTSAEDIKKFQNRGYTVRSLLAPSSLASFLCVSLM